MNKFSGVFTALVTPFKNGEIDFKSLKNLVQFQLENGIEGFVVLGTTAESPVLSSAERYEVFKAVKEESKGRVPLVVGTGTNSTSETVRYTKEAQEWGADGALVVVPYYNKPPQRGLYAHYQKVAEASSLPVLLYNVPGRTITKLDLETIVELSKVKGIVGIKEASGDIEFDRQIRAKTGNDFLLTTGDDSTYVEFLQAGGNGVISVASHILPVEFVRWARKVRENDKNVTDDFKKYRELIDYLFVEANPIPVKMALHLLGVIDSPELRLPLVTLENDKKEELRSKMKAVGIL